MRVSQLLGHGNEDRLDELFGSRGATVHRGDAQWHGSFEVADVPFEFSFTRETESEGDNWGFLFALETDYASKHNTPTVANSGLSGRSGVRVLGIVVNLIREFLTDRAPDSLEFLANKQDGRDTLYAQIARHLERDLTGMGFQIERTPRRGFTRFTIRHRPPVEGAARLDELKNVRGTRREFEDEADFRNYMEGNGFFCQGEGHYGMVFTHRSFHGKYLLKVFQDQHYEAFIEIAKRHADNPHFPKFVGSVMRVNETVRMVRVEILKPLGRSEVEALDGSFAFMEMRMQAEDIASGDLDMDEAEVEPRYQGFFEALCEVYREKPADAVMDMHRLNVMLRGTTLVITDPYKGGKRFAFRNPLA